MFRRGIGRVIEDVVRRITRAKLPGGVELELTADTSEVAEIAEHALPTPPESIEPPELPVQADDTLNIVVPYTFEQLLRDADANPKAAVRVAWERVLWEVQRHGVKNVRFFALAYGTRRQLGQELVDVALRLADLWEVLRVQPVAPTPAVARDFVSAAWRPTVAISEIPVQAGAVVRGQGGGAG